MQVVRDLGVDLPLALVAGQHLGRLERVAGGLRADAVLGGQQHDVLERHAGARVLRAPRGDRVLGQQELGGERVGADLVGVVLEGADRDLPVDDLAVPHPQMAELVGEREALARDRLICADEDQRAAGLGDVGPGDPLGEIEDDDVRAALLGHPQDVGQWPLACQAQLRPCLARALRAGVGVLARHPGSVWSCQIPRAPGD